MQPGLPMPEGAPAAPLLETAEVTGEVERIVYENPESGYVVARLREPDRASLTTFVGKNIAVTPGETVRLRGQWIDDKRYGRQLQVASFESILPASIEGIEKYLGSGLIAGIGPKYAKRLVDAFGAETFRVIDEEPGRLERVPGIGRARAQRIRDAWHEQRALQSVFVFLQGHGLSTALARKIYKQYGDRTLALLRANPYRLAEDIWGVSFRGADAIAGKLGVPKDAPERIEAALLHVLREAQGHGHAFLPLDELRTAAADLVQTPIEAVDLALHAIGERREAVREGDSIYLAGMHAAESGVARLLHRLVATPREPIAIKMEAALAWAEAEFGIALSERQRDAVRQGVTAKALVITGGPGTGKTTIIRCLLGILEKKGQSFLLAAPTGRAAKRMEEATGREARTLHRLLEFSPKHGGFTRHEGNPLATDLLVIDEASMIDLPLMHAVLRALPPFARLVLVGDVDQLPSVGAGSVLLDVIASGAVGVVRLDTVFRQAEESGIVANAHRINAGEYPRFNATDFFFIERKEPGRALDTIVELVARRLPRRYGLEAWRDIQVLCPMRRGDVGAQRINEALQAALNPDGAPMPRGGLRAGDKVMQLRNNYDLEVFNGDIGRISLFEPEAQEFEVTFDDGRKVLYPLDDLDNLGLAYACTVHKSQGSEYPCVVLPFLTQHYMMLQRNVLYTAVTRAKRLVVVAGDPRALHIALRNTQTARRNTALTGRLRNAKYT